MSKGKQVLMVIGGVVLIYIVVSVFIVFLANTAVSVNTSMAAAHNFSNYPGFSGFLLSCPWLLYVIPAVGGIIWIILILRRRDEGARY